MCANSLECISMMLKYFRNYEIDIIIDMQYNKFPTRNGMCSVHRLVITSHKINPVALQSLGSRNLHFNYVIVYVT